MTIPFPLDAFDNARPITRRSPKPHVDTHKLVSVALTIAFHVVILAAALTAVHVSHSRVMQELKISILPEQKKVDPKDLAPPPKLVQPAMVTVPPPQVVIQTVTPPPVAAQPAPAAAPVPNAAPRSPVAGDGRDAYLGRILAQLNRFKQYPRQARAAHIEGVVMLHFVMDASGKVLSFEIARSSGRPILDAEALALIQRAQPLPVLPPDFPTKTLDAVVPVEFSSANDLLGFPQNTGEDMESKSRRGLLTKGAAAAAGATLLAGSADARTRSPARLEKRSPYPAPNPPPAKAPLYSRAVAYGNMLFLSGVGYHKPGMIEDHTRGVLDEISKNLEEAGSSLQKCLKVNVYLNDLKDYAAMNAVYFTYNWGGVPPVRTTVSPAAGIPGNSLIEIDCIAYI